MLLMHLQSHDEFQALTFLLVIVQSKMPIVLPQRHLGL